MPNDDDRKRRQADRFSRVIAGKEARKMRARTADKGVAFWLGMMGLVGWSVTVPTLLGLALGAWMDRTWPAPFSWTLTMLIAGVVVGCATAWYWVQRESTRER